MPARTQTAPPATAIVEAERAFMSSVRSRGVRDGFLAWLAPTAVVFRPGPVEARRSYERLPAGWNGLLEWRPLRAAVSADGRLGWSTGPWTWKRDSTARKLDASGQYLTVWRRQADGPWRAVLACGVDQSRPEGLDGELAFSAPVSGERLGSRPLAARQSLYQADASFARIAASEGLPSAVARYATDDVVVLRANAPRFVGRDAARDSLAARGTTADLMSTAQWIADSGDLGYTYGSFVTGRGAAADSSWYVHVWHRGAAATWRLAAQVVMPLPATGTDSRP